MQVQQMTLSFIIFVCAGLILNLPGPEKLTGKRNENSAVYFFFSLFKGTKNIFLKIDPHSPQSLRYQDV